MSDCGAGPSSKRRFKGIENFLRRVAFNLGNTPSQTEVKIISCIPIDVTDLQQKILHLERQLDEFRRNPQGKPNCVKPSGRTPVNTALYDRSYNSTPVNAEVSCKSLEVDRGTSPPIPQDKRKSNVAFTLKEKEDEPTAYEYSTPGPEPDSKDDIDTPPPPPPKCTDTIQCANEPKICDRRQTDKNKEKKFFKKKHKILKKKARSTCVYYAQTNNLSPFRTDLNDEFKNMNSDIMSRSYLNKMINKQYKPTLLGDKSSQISEFSSPICRDSQPRSDNFTRFESDVCSCIHGTFQNIDSHINHPQTYMLNEIKTGNAYYDTKHYDLIPVKEKSAKTKKDIEMPRKKETKTQHVDIRCWPENVRTKCRPQPMYVSPKPAVNHQKFSKNDYVVRNGLDTYMRRIPLRVNKMEPCYVNRAGRRRRDFDRIKHPLNVDVSRSCSIDFGSIYYKKVYKKPKEPIFIKTHPVGALPRKNAECLTTTIHNTDRQTTTNHDIQPTETKTEETLNQIKSILQSVLAEVKVTSQTRSQTSEDKSKKDAVVQKGMSQSNIQGSSYMNSITYSPYAMHPNGMPGAYMPSCSRQMNANQLCFPPSTMKCFQNFPLFIPAPARHMCVSCLRPGSDQKPSNEKHANTIATNTDDVKEKQSKETEKLIKEIYKSMALTMEVPNKETSMSDYEELVISTPTDYKKKPMYEKIRTEVKEEPRKKRNVVQAVSELFMKKDGIESSITPNTTIELSEDSKAMSKETHASTQSRVVTSDTEDRVRKDRCHRYLRSGDTTQSTTTETDRQAHREPRAHNATTHTTSEASFTDTQCDSIVILQKDPHDSKQKKEKPGIFTKMLKSVKLFKPKEKEKTRKKEDKSASDAESDSDSDDYQTIYSQKIEKTLKNSSRPSHIPKRKTHSKISYKQSYQRDKSPEKRKPYMEQEYRRYWNERLMFHDNKPRHSSEQPYTTTNTNTPVPRRPAYYQAYEARSAFVEPKKTHIPKTTLKKLQMPREIHRTKVEPRMTAKGMAWLKKHKMGLQCADQWKKFILEN